MRLSVFAYPWDLGALGVERTLERLAESGFESLYLAATYHPIDALAPRDGKVHLFSSGRGAVHVPVTPSRYGAIRPATSSPEIGAVWTEVARRAPEVGITLVPWVIALYQPWIVDQRPETARVLPSGDPIGLGVCPANEDVRSYVAELCGDLVDQFGVEAVHLEGTAPASFDYGWLRPRVLVDISPVARELLALCFCPSCRRRGEVAGVDVDGVQARVNAAVAFELGMSPPPVSAEPGGLDTDAELHVFLDGIVRASCELADHVRERVAAAHGIRLSGMLWSPFSELLGAHRDAAFDAMLRPFDQAMVLANGRDPWTDVARAARTARGLELAVMLTPGRPKPPSGAPDPSGARMQERAADVWSRATAIDATEVALYNYGLLRESDVDAVARHARAEPLP